MLIILVLLEKSIIFAGEYGKGKWVSRKMSNKEIKEFTAKLEKGLRIAEKRMLEEKALHNETVVVSNSEGKIEYIPAKEVLTSY